MKLKGCSIGVGMLQAMGPKKKAARGREKMNQGTMQYSKWELESKEKNQQSQGKFLVQPIAPALNGGQQLYQLH